MSLSYRRSKLPARSIKYWLMPEINGLIESGRIAAHFGTVPTRVTPARVDLGPWADPDEPADPALFQVAAAAAPASIEADFVLALIGYEADMALVLHAGVELRGECQTPTFDERTMETNVTGVFVAGTAVAGTQDKYRVFIENCHVHVARITAALQGATPPAAPRPYEPPRELIPRKGRAVAQRCGAAASQPGRTESLIAYSPRDDNVVSVLPGHLPARASRPINLIAPPASPSTHSGESFVQAQLHRRKTGMPAPPLPPAGRPRGPSPAFRRRRSR